MRRSLLLALLLFPLLSFAQQKSVTFQKKGSKKTFTAKTYELCTVRLKNGHSLAGYIESMDDSVIHFHAQVKGKGPKRQDMQQVMHDGSLSREERNRRMYALIYPDTQAFSFAATKRLHFSLLSHKFGGLRAAGGGLVFGAGCYVFFASIVNDPNGLKISPALGIPAFVGGLLTLYVSSNKIIRPKKWEIAPAKT